MDEDQLTLTFAALADPTRRAILQRLASGEAVVKDIALPFAMSAPAISRHLRGARKAGLIEQGRQAQWRPRRLRAEPLADASDWLLAYRPLWEERFDRMDAVLKQMTKQAAKPAAKPKTPAGKTRRRIPSKNE